MLGKVTNIHTNAVEIRFVSPSNRLEIDQIVLMHEQKTFLQIKKILSSTTVLAIVITAEQNPKIGETATATFKQLIVPVGEGAKSHVFNIKGIRLDGAPVTKEIKYIPMNSLASLNKNLNRKFQILETGIKAIDFFIPILEGSKLGILGGAGVGKTVLMKEIIFNASKSAKKVSSIFIGSGERSREGLELYNELNTSKLLPNTTMFVAQMNESPGARMNIVPFGITAAEYLRDVQKENVFLFIDNIYRFLQGSNEVSSTLGVKPTIGGYHATLESDISKVEERLYATQNAAITSFQTVFLPMDDLSDPAAIAIFTHLDASLVLSREQVVKNLYPAFDPLASNSSSVNPLIIGDDHFNTLLETRSILQKYKDLEDVILILGIDELDEDNQVIVKKALQLQNFFTQRFFVAENYTREPGVYVTLKDTIASVKRILKGEFLHINPEEFTFIGTVSKFDQK